MKKDNVFTIDGVTYYEENGQRYCFIKFNDCDPEIQKEVIKKLKKEQPELLNNEEWFYNTFLPNYNVRLKAMDDKDVEKVIEKLNSINCNKSTSEEDKKIDAEILSLLDI